MADRIGRHPLKAYFVIACAITWVVVSPLVLAGLGVLDLHLAPAWHTVWNAVALAAAVLSPTLVAVTSASLGACHTPSRQRRSRFL